MSDINDDFAAELAAEAQTEAERPKVEGALESIQKLAAEVLELDKEITKLEDQVKVKKGLKNEILGKRLVDVMTEVNVDSVVVNGITFSCGSYYHASIPEEHAVEAHAWLEENEHGDIIKYQIIVSLPKDSEKLARDIETAVRQLSNEAEIETKRSVPWKRLTSWLKEYVEKVMPHDPKLPPVPLEKFGATVGRVVKFKAK